MFRTLIYPSSPASACNTDATPTQPHRNSNTHRTKNNTTNVVIQQNSRKLVMMDILMSETCWAHKKWNKIASDIKLVFYSTITMMHGPIYIRLLRYRSWKPTEDQRAPREEIMGRRTGRKWILHTVSSFDRQSEPSGAVNGVSRVISIRSVYTGSPIHFKLEAPQQTHFDLPTPTAELRNAELLYSFLQCV